MYDQNWDYSIFDDVEKLAGEVQRRVEAMFLNRPNISLPELTGHVIVLIGELFTALVEDDKTAGDEAAIGILSICSFARARLNKKYLEEAVLEFARYDPLQFARSSVKPSFEGEEDKP